MKKAEITIFGIIPPLCLTIHTALLLLQEEAIFWGRGSTIVYHGREAYFVSLLWFGLSLLLFACFFLKPQQLITPSTYKGIQYLSISLIILGLASVFLLA